MPPQVRVNYSIVFVSDMAGSVVFYRDVMGLPLKFESPHWTEFATDGATLALHLDAAAGRCRPGLSVPNLEEFHARVTAAGGRCIQPPTVVFGARVAQYQDPDGLTISVGEAVAEQPAQTPTSAPEPATAPAATAKGAKPKPAKAPAAKPAKKR